MISQNGTSLLGGGSTFFSPEFRGGLRFFPGRKSESGTPPGHISIERSLRPKKKISFTVPFLSKLLISEKELMERKGKLRMNANLFLKLSIMLHCASLLALYINLQW